MNLSKRAIEEYIEIYEQECGVKLEFAEATEKANNFMNAFKAVSYHFASKDNSVEAILKRVRKRYRKSKKEVANG
ncbi:MAG: hypothetical protein HRT47_04275 [Candidatus Caenarcaniphilales bacterium]|nr:hypothetical protein [Candidatus Caenarcaniphilales bacterium]